MKDHTKAIRVLKERRLSIENELNNKKSELNHISQDVRSLELCISDLNLSIDYLAKDT